jgi:uncharacterized metal-binding protein
MNHTSATNAGVIRLMSEEQVDIVCVVMEMIGGTIDNYDKDQYHAPARWVLNNWWHSLNAVLALQVGDETHSESDTLKTAHDAKRKK